MYQNFGNFTTLWLIFGIILLHMCRNSNYRASGHNNDNDIGFTQPDFLQESKNSIIGKHL